MSAGAALRLAAVAGATDSADPSYPDALGNFVTALFRTFRADGLDALRHLTAIDLAATFAQPAALHGTREPLQALLAGAAIAEREDPAWLFAFGLCSDLGFALPLVSKRPPDGLRRLAAWMGRCALAELAFDPSAELSAGDAWCETEAAALEEALARCLDAGAPAAPATQGTVVGGSLVQAALDALRFLNRHATLRYLLQVGRRKNGRLRDNSAPSPARDLAAIVCTPLTRLPDLEALLAEKDLRELLRVKYRVQDYLFDDQDEVDADLRARELLASAVVAGLDVAGAVDHDDVLRALELCAPRGYSSTGDYRELQRLRARGYDTVVRQRHADVDQPIEAPRPGTVGLLMSTLSPSAERTASLMYARALALSGHRPVIVLWPHNGGGGDSDADFEAEFQVVDLRFAAFAQRVAVVRQLRLHALLIMNNATWGWSEYIAACCFRLARVQILTYLSPVTVGFRNIDHVLVGTASEGKGAEGRYLEKPLWMEGSVLCFARPDVPRQGVGPSGGSTGKGPGAPRVAACGASLPKLTPSSLAMVFAVAKRLALDEVVFYPFNPSWGVAANDLFRAHLRRQAARGGFTGRVRVAGPFADQEPIWDLLQRCAVYVDSFPHSGGLSVLDAIECGLPVVFRSGDAQRSLQARNVVEATNAAGIDMAVRDAEDVLGKLLAAAAHRPAAASPEGPLFDPAAFGRLLADALRGLGVAPPASASPSDARPFAFRHAYPASVLRSTGRSVAYFDPCFARSHPAPVRGSGALILSYLPTYEVQFLNRSSGFRSSVGRFTFESDGDRSIVFVVDCRDAEVGEQLRMEAGGERSGWANPMLPGFNAGVMIACNVCAGTNVIDIQSSHEPTRLRIGRTLRIAATGGVSRSEVKARWRSLGGFSAWEGASPTHGLDAPFRWCVGPTSRLDVLVDRPDVQGLCLEVKVAASAFHIILEAEAWPQPLRFHRDVGAFDDVEVLGMDGRLAEGWHAITLRPEVAAVSPDRDITLIVRNVTLICSP